MTYWQDKRDGQVFVQEGDSLVCYSYCRQITKRAADQELMISRLEGEGEGTTDCNSGWLPFHHARQLSTSEELRLALEGERA